MNYKQVVETVNKIFEEYEIRLTVRQLYYRCVSPPFQIFANTRNCYTGFDKILTKAREQNDVDWRQIEDRTRQTIGGDYGYDNPDAYLDAQISMLKDSASGYTKEMWITQPHIVELWVEKDALSTLFSEVARGFRIVTFPSRGYSSFTKIIEAIVNRFNKYIKLGKQIIILHFTDLDPSGLDMTDDIHERFYKRGYLIKGLRESFNNEELQSIKETWQKLSEKTMLRIVRCALTFEQVKQFNLASNPTKMADPRAKDYVAKYSDQCWELDSLPPDELQKIIRESIQQYIDAKEWNKVVEQTQSEKTKLQEKLSKIKITFE